MKHVVTLVLSLMLLSGTASANRELQLPVLGDTSSAISSPYQEQQLGREVLRLYRSRMPTSSDYQVVKYLEDLLNQLAVHSELEDPSLQLVVIENPNINAFAAPGGIIGVNTGLLNYAENEHQLASVLAHELAHLSQRHYARRLQQQQQMSVPYYAALLGSLILAATSGSDAGIAAMMSTQAAALDAQLRFSRQFEQEADRLGMQTMARAGLDPNAASDIFEIMLRATRYTERPPEFLLTHPVTERRIADTRNRAMNLPRTEPAVNLEYHLMRARTRVEHEQSAQRAVQLFQSELDAKREPLAASRYGLALAQIRAGQFDAAEATMAPLLEEEPDRLTYQLLAAELATERGSHEAALERLRALHQTQPDHYAVTMHYALALMKANRFEQSTELLNRFSRQRRDDPAVWYWLAEVSGLAGDIQQVHEARAEYFIQVGAYSQALQQLQNALKRTDDDSTHTRILLRERIKQVEEMQRTAARIL
ncbi:M48 family metalloprotease [Marinimicrobium sp. LS-A18]|uniref:M48 family metalloprotease n=1 Tax=Marinimicrobium sp. LS-A18 TaxID=1381596 RepID=UPI0004650F84|nr:M48 family metalloprotease [Marinimicrobium sp. LS-A18]